MKFADRKNLIDNFISTGVEHVSYPIQDTGDVDEVASDYIQDTGDTDEVFQHAHKVDEDPHDNANNPSNNEENDNEEEGISETSVENSLD